MAVLSFFLTFQLGTYRDLSSFSFSGHTPPILPSHFFIQGSYSGSLVFSALEEKEQESEFVAVNPARRSHRYPPKVLQIANKKFLVFENFENIHKKPRLRPHKLPQATGHRPRSLEKLLTGFLYIFRLQITNHTTTTKFTVELNGESPLDGGLSARVDRGKMMLKAHFHQVLIASSCVIAIAWLGSSPSLAPYLSRVVEQKKAGEHGVVADSRIEPELTAAAEGVRLAAV